MQEHQVTIGGETFGVPEPFLVLATQNPIESEGTYDLPEAQVDRFLFKLVVDYPAVEDEIAVVDRVSVETPAPRRAIDVEDLIEHQRVAREVFADRATMAYAVALVDATRHPGRYGLADLEPLIQFGASPRASLGLVQGARALALLRGRTYVAHHDVRDLAPDVLRHRLVLSYDALADQVRPDDLIDRVLATVEPARPVRLAEAA
jgi:MoxR-like ATPase